MRKLLILTAAVLLLGGCSIYKLDVQQGNLIDEDVVAQLRPGMDRQQVVYLMGTPLLQDPFHADRWDYFYRLRNGEGDVVDRQRVTLHFNGDRLARIVPELVNSEGVAAGE